MIEFLVRHEIMIVAGGAYLLTAMVNALPEPPAKFELYPWVVHVSRSLLNAVPPKYKDAIKQVAPEEKKV